MDHTGRAITTLFGQVRPGDWDQLVPIGVLVFVLTGVIGLGIWAVMRIRRWREELVEENVPAPATSLEGYRKMVDDGLLDPQEFERIKAQLQTNNQSTTADSSLPLPPPAVPPGGSIQEK